jgi:hypothetical protein
MSVAPPVAATDTVLRTAELHGMGPRAITILRESLADRGLALHDEEAK